MSRASLALIGLLMSAAVASAGALDDASLATAWPGASQDERDAWLAAFKFGNANVDRARVSACIDKMTAWEALATNKLTSVTSLCETTVEKGAM